MAVLLPLIVAALLGASRPAIARNKLKAFQVLQADMYTFIYELSGDTFAWLRLSPALRDNDRIVAVPCGGPA